MVGSTLPDWCKGRVKGRNDPLLFQKVGQLRDPGNEVGGRSRSRLTTPSCNLTAD